MVAKRAHHPMHIKRRTRGSSNEISFSVLDAAREARDAEERDRREGGSGGPSLFTLGKGKKPRPTPVKGQSIVLSGEAPASPSASSSAVDRKMRGIVPVFVVVCALLVITLVGGQALMSMREQQKSLLDTLNDQVDIIKSCDESLLPFDELVIEQCDAKRLSPSATGDAAPSAEALNEGYRAVVAEIAPMRAQLEDSIASMETLQSSLSDNDDKEAASQVVTAARSRLNMLDAGVSIIEESMMATEAFLKARSGWNAVINADAAIREATALAEEMSKENILASQAKGNEALAFLEEAQQDFSQAEAAYLRSSLSSSALPCMRYCGTLSSQSTVWMSVFLPQPLLPTRPIFPATRKSSRLRTAAITRWRRKRPPWPKNSGKMTQSKSLLFDSTKRLRPTKAPMRPSA